MTVKNWMLLIGLEGRKDCVLAAFSLLVTAASLLERTRCIRERYEMSRKLLL